ncbi:MAG: hypothetical protein U0610_09910 [bacterium]
MPAVAPHAEPPFGERLAYTTPRALALAAIAALLAYPSSLVLASRNPGHLPEGLAVGAVAGAQALLVGVEVALAAFIGLMWRQRAGLPGLRRAPTAPRPLIQLPAFVVTGAALGALSGFAFDRAHAAAAPGLYAANGAEALALYAGSVLSQEAVARMCFLTILAALLDRPRAALVLHALWTTFFTFTLEQRFLHASATPTGLDWCGLAFGLAANLIFGGAYASHGLAGAVVTHAAWNLKLLVVRAG